MSEQPQSIWKRPWKGAGGFFGWFLVAAAAGFVLFFSSALLSGVGSIGEITLFSAAGAIGIALVGTLAVGFCHWIRHWPNLRGLLFGLACLATVIALFYAEEDVRGRSAWLNYKRKWEAKGFRLDVPGVAPAPVPDELNFAMAPIVASSYSQMLDHNGRVIDPRNTNIIDRMRMPREVERVEAGTNLHAASWQKAEMTDLAAWQAYYRSAAAVTNLFPVPQQAGAPAADVLLALSIHEPAIEELRQAAQRPQSRFPLTYDADNPAAILLPHLAPLKGVAQTLQLRAVAELEAGQSDKALDDFKLMLRLSDAVRTEPTLISQLVRVAIVQIALQPVWEGLAAHRWSDAQLVVLQKELGRQDFLADFGTGMRAEAALASGVIDYLRRNRKELSMLFDTSSEGINTYTLLARVAPAGWYYQNQLNCVRYELETVLPLADLEHRTVSPAASQLAIMLGERRLTRRNPFTALGSVLVPALANAVRRFAFEQNAVDLARVACALERHRLAEGGYPASLGALVPQFIDTLPHDVINGAPLHYSRTADGRFTLYSVGWNETDDGGEVGLKGKSESLDLTLGDWTWPSPPK